VNELLDISRIQANKLEFHLEHCDLASIVRDAVQDQLLESDAVRRTIHVNIPAEQSVPIIADADRIGQVVSNYLSNALKYSAEQQPVNVSLQLEGPSAHVLVNDQGPGLPFAEQQHIWDRFYRAQDIEVQSGSGIGLGLGLYICRTIIERHKRGIDILALQLFANLKRVEDNKQVITGLMCLYILAIRYTRCTGTIQLYSSWNT
jgi:signal transduction histidine kinase